MIYGSALSRTSRCAALDVMHRKVPRHYRTGLTALMLPDEVCQGQLSVLWFLVRLVIYQQPHPWIEIGSSSDRTNIVTEEDLLRARKMEAKSLICISIYPEPGLQVTDSCAKIKPINNNSYTSNMSLKISIHFF
jgi:hypothetical protein